MSDYQVIAELRDSEGLGLCAEVTRKVKRNGYVQFSWTIFKEFERKPGQARRSSWKNDRHIGAARVLLDRVEECIQREREKLAGRVPTIAAGDVGAGGVGAGG